MKASQISIGGVYLAKVSNRIVQVRVNSFDMSGPRMGYKVTNLTTGRSLRFKSAAKFRSAA